MTLAEMEPALKDAAGLEVNPGARYLFFVDVAAVPLSTVKEIDIGVDWQVVFVHVPAGSSIRDVVAAFQVPEGEPTA